MSKVVIKNKTHIIKPGELANFAKEPGDTVDHLTYTISEWDPVTEKRIYGTAVQGKKLPPCPKSHQFLIPMDDRKPDKYYVITFGELLR